MNFLAHCALATDAASAWQCTAEQRTGLLAGAVIGDFLKGRVPTDWPVALQAGVRLHRRIDAISNQDPGLKAICAHFPGNLRRLAPIFLDLLADHALARQWHDYYAVDLQAFSQECYAAIATYDDYLPRHGRRFASYMQAEDLLANYHQWQHVAAGAQSVLRRLAMPDLSQHVETSMRAVVAPTQAGLADFYPRLQAPWHDWNAVQLSVAPQSS